MRLKISTRSFVCDFLWESTTMTSHLCVSRCSCYHIDCIRCVTHCVTLAASTLGEEFIFVCVFFSEPKPNWSRSDLSFINFAAQSSGPSLNMKQLWKRKCSTNKFPQSLNYFENLAFVTLCFFLVIENCYPDYYAVETLMYYFEWSLIYANDFKVQPNSFLLVIERWCCAVKG